MSHIKMVVSASSNNEGYSTGMKGWHTHHISSHRFDDVEFATWCNQYQLKDGPVDPVNEDALDALYWSGNIYSNY